MTDIQLLNCLQEIVYTSDKAFVTFLLDGSSSISPQDFQTLKDITCQLIVNLKGSNVQIIQFSSSSRIECPFTIDENISTKAVRGMVQMKGSTNMIGGIQTTIQTLIYSIEDVSQLVFLITDGEPDSCPKSEIQKLLLLKCFPKIIGIGVGKDLNVKKLKYILNGQEVFHCSDFTTLVRVVKSLTTKPINIDPAIRIVFTPKNNDLQKSKSNLLLELQCEPDYPNESLPPGTLIKFLDNENFYIEVIELNRVVTKKKPLVCDVKLSIKDPLKGKFPEKIFYEAKIPGSIRGDYRGSISMNVGWLAGDFIFQKNPDIPINILVWGPMGCGKTSFINSILTVLNPKQEVVQPFTSFRATSHVTRSYTRNFLADYIDESTSLGKILKQKLKLCIWDIWGVTQTCFQQLQITSFLEGRVPDGTEMNDIVCNNPVQEENKIHSVILIIPIGTSQDSKTLEILREHIETIVRFGIRPVIVINYLDSFGSDQEEIKKAYELIYISSGLNKSDIFMVNNYEHEQFKNIQKDLVYWDIMTKCFSEASKTLNRIISKSNFGSTNKIFPKIKCVGSKICGNKDCENVGEEVETPFCPYCGEKVLEENPPPTIVRFCLNENCTNLGSIVDEKFKRCGYCGQVPNQRN
eukprot:gene6027-7511_t